MQINIPIPAAQIFSLPAQSFNVCTRKLLPKPLDSTERANVPARLIVRAKIGYQI